MRFFSLFFGSDFLYEIVEEFTMFEATVVEADAIETANVAKFAVGKSIDFLNEYVFDTFLTKIEFADEGIA